MYENRRHPGFYELYIAVKPLLEFLNKYYGEQCKAIVTDEYVEIVKGDVIPQCVVHRMNLI